MSLVDELYIHYVTFLPCTCHSLVLTIIKEGAYSSQLSITTFEYT